MVIKRLAQQAYQGARQHADLLRDLSMRPQPSDGVFVPGENIFFWFKDSSKIKGTRQMAERQGSTSRRTDGDHRGEQGRDEGEPEQG